MKAYAFRLLSELKGTKVRFKYKGREDKELIVGMNNGQKRYNEGVDDQPWH
jgi:hypothetical protein